MTALRTWASALRARVGALARRACAGGDDSGNAIVEFLGAALLLLVPLVYLVLVLGRLQAATFATAGAAREAARAYTVAETVDEAQARAVASAGLALADQGFVDASAQSLDVACSAACLTPGSEVAVSVEVRVPLPFVPPFVRHVVPLEIPVRAASTAVVDDYREAPP